MKYLMQYENFWKNLFSKNDKLSKGDYVRVKKWKDVGQIVSLISKDPITELPEGFVIKFNHDIGRRRNFYYTDELEKITKDEFDLDNNINKFNI